MNINEGQTIWIEKYRPTCVQDLVLPEYIKKKFKTYVDKEDIPNLGFFSSNPGCVLSGTSVKVQAKPKWRRKRDLVKKYDLDNRSYVFLKKYTPVKKSSNFDFIDENSISFALLSIAKSESKFHHYYHHDDNFNNKFLKFEYWINKLNDVELAYKKVKSLRKFKDYFEFDADNLPKKLRNFKNVDSILKSQLDLIYKENFEIPQSSRRVDFWVWRGYTTDEAIKKIKHIQNNAKHINYEKRINNTDIEYYINKGLSEDDAKKALHDRQCTFSLRKCIDRYGEEIGLDVFNERQRRWQNTLNSKSQKEIDRINMSKGSKPKIKRKCKLYYIRIYDEDIEFYKVGITTKTVKERWSSLGKSGLLYDILLEEEFNSVDTAYAIEQIILNHPKRKIINYKYFKSTECFEQDIRNDI